MPSTSPRARNEQKAVNLRTNRYVTLTTGCNQWEEGIDVVVEGEAVQVTDKDLLTRLAAAWAAKWDGRWHYEVQDHGFHRKVVRCGLVFSVMPTKVLAFAKGAFGQTRTSSDRPVATPDRLDDSQTAACISALIVTSA